MTMLSIIIPAYNVESYIVDCLSSVYNNDFFQCANYSNSVEVIIVNDGSTDETLDRINHFICGKDGFFVFSKKNGGLSDARNYGLSKSKGEYIFFLDSDDLISRDFISDLFHHMKTRDVDLISFDFFKFYDSNLFSNENVYDPSVSMIEKVDSSFYVDQPVFAWNKVYARKLFDHLKFDKGLYYEDVALIPLLIDFSKNKYHMQKKYYGYRQRHGSITSCRDDKYLDILFGVNKIYSLSNSVFIQNVVMNQFFTLSLLSLRLSLRKSVCNLIKVMRFYRSNFPVNYFKPSFKYKQVPFSIFRRVGLLYLFFALLAKPFVMVHLYMKKCK